MVRLGRGKWKGHLLRPSSMRCRPTSALVRGAVFDIAGERVVVGSPVWDLCCGTGAVGLEALSIGASHAVFVDRDRRRLGPIGDFLREHLAEDRARLIAGDLRRVLPLPGAPPGLVFIDPPYAERYLYDWIWSVAWGSILAPGGLLFVESGRDPAREGWSSRRYGDSWLGWTKGPC